LVAASPDAAAAGGDVRPPGK